MSTEYVSDPEPQDPDPLIIDVAGNDHVRRERVTVAGEMDIVSAPLVHETITDVLRRGPSRIEIDLHDVTFLDSAGIRALLMCHADAARADCELALVDPHPRVHRVPHITGLLGYFHLTAEPAATDRSTRSR